MGGGEKYPKFNKEYLWNHWTDLDHVKTIRREISLSYLKFKQIKKSNFSVRKTCVSYQPCDIFIRLRDREPNHVLLKTFLNERKWNTQDGGLKPEVDTAKRLFPFPHSIATRFYMIYVCFRGRPYQWDMFLYLSTKLGGNRKWKIQDGGLHPWNAYIWPPRLASNAIPTDILMFSGSAILMGHVSILYD